MPGWTLGPWRISGQGTIRAGDGWIGDVHWRNRKANAALIAASPDLAAQHDSNLVDLDFLRRAIVAGDPTAELLIRVDDLIRRSRAALNKALGKE